MSSGTAEQWSEEAEQKLRDAGWFPGRRVSTDHWEETLREHGGFVMHETAREFLAEFGGLEVDQRGPGQNMAKMPFKLDPVAAEYDDEIFDVLSEEAGVDLYPIGEVDRRNNYLGIAPDGSVYIGMDTVALFADNAHMALENLIKGRQ